MIGPHQQDGPYKRQFTPDWIGAFWVFSSLDWTLPASSSSPSIEKKGAREQPPGLRGMPLPHFALQCVGSGNQGMMIDD